VLDLLMEGAQDLSQLRPTHALMAASKGSEGGGGGLLAEAGPRVQGKRALVVEAGDGSSSSSKSDNTALSTGKTRRWGYRRGRAPQAQRNLFGPVAARAFFCPLVHGVLQHAGWVFLVGEKEDAKMVIAHAL
jgi:hypothetical protein